MTETADRWDAPWTNEEVGSLAEYQRTTRFHPYTCGNDSRHPHLVPTRAGWVCDACDYTQTWAHRHGRPASPRKEHE